MTILPDISLLVCTRNRCTSLMATLGSIARAAAAVPDHGIEVIVVDNGSIDETPRLLDRWSTEQCFPIHVIREDRPGLARARNTGLSHTRAAIIAMTDDDCLLHAGYFAAIALAFADTTGATIIGGRILPGDPVDLPVTLKLEDHPMTAAPDAFPGGFVMGANLAFTRDVLARVGPFDERFGAGAPFVAAEDTDFLFRAMRLGIAVRYDPRFMVDHHHGRRRVEDETSLLAGYGFGDGALYAKHLLRDRRIAAIILRDLADLWRDIADPVTTHAGIRFFYTFRLRHKIRGFISYWCRRSMRCG